MLITNLVFFILSCIVLVLSSSQVIRALVKVAEYYRINEFAVGFIIIAVSTSLPELFVGITSSFNNEANLVVGNVIGANILNLTLIIGIAALLSRGIRIRSSVIKKDFLFMLGIVILPLLLMIDHVLSRFEGLILVIVFCLYIWQMVKQERRFHKIFEIVNKKEAMSNAMLGVVSLFILIISANYVVIFATNLSVDLALPTIIIGLLVLSLGTSLPELVLNAKAVLQKHQELAVGDTLGSVITNSTLVLGVAALIRPIQVDVFFFFTSALFLIVVSFIFITFGESNRGISWKEGLSLIMLYIFFVVIQTYITLLRT